MSTSCRHGMPAHIDCDECTIEELVGRVEALEAALKPFADIGRGIPTHRGDDPIADDEERFSPPWPTFGDFRHAAALLPKSACGCQTCRPITMTDQRMVLCETCGNKRCPHATNHRNECTGSNEPGQPGSVYQ